MTLWLKTSEGGPSPVKEKNLYNKRIGKYFSTLFMIPNPFKGGSVEETLM